MRRHSPLLFFLLLAVPLAGCTDGPRMSQVSGAVTVDGVPLESGDISFYPISANVPTSGEKIRSGTYKASVPFGEMKVVISAPKVVGQKKLYPNDPKSPTRDLTVEALPDRYNEKSELKLDVNASVMKQDFILKK